jgi:Ion channel
MDEAPPEAAGSPPEPDADQAIEAIEADEAVVAEAESGDQDDIRSTLPGGRHGWTLRERFRAPDSYGLLLFLILICMLSLSALSDGSWQRALSATLLAGTLLFALRTSRAGHGIMVAAYVVLPLVVVGAAFASAADSQTAHVLQSSMILLLLLGVLGAVLARMGTHATISWETVLAGVCVYLLVGLAFGSVFSLLGAVNDGVLFAGDQPATTLNTTYYSFTTLSTVGYGDLSMAEGFPKMLSVTEAVLGQIYLVVAVGLLIGNLGRRREPRREALGDRRAARRRERSKPSR